MYMKDADTVIIIDDDQMDRALLGNIFKDKYKILEASGGMEGFNKILEKQDEICAVLLDVIMPGMSGIDVLRKLRGENLMDRIPVFLITAEATDSVLKEAYVLGVMDVISKPFVSYVIEKRIGSVIELFRARRRLSCTVEEQRDKITRQEEKIVDLNRGMVEALATAIEFRSIESGEHVKRIHDITKYMLENTVLGEGFTGGQIDLIAVASIVHDVGKISIPDSILNKPGRLTPDEYEIMKTHAAKGGELLEQIPQLREHESFQYAYDIARHHHERWDGTGYPDGLKGNEIPVYTQIVSIADVYDALISRRVYKDPLEASTAWDMISSGECGAFNPRLLDSFFSVEKEIRKFYRAKS